MIDKVARVQAGRSICKEVLYDQTKNGGVGVPHIHTKMMIARINAALRMYNATDTICAAMLKWDLRQLSNRIMYEEGYKPAKGEMPVENTAPIHKNTGLTGSIANTSWMICMAMRNFKVTMRLTDPEYRGEWIPQASEYHPKIEKLAKMKRTH